MTIYHQIASILTGCLDQKKSIKSLVMESQTGDKKRLMAIVCQILKYRECLEELLEKTQIVAMEKKILTKPLALALIFDFLIGKGIQCGGSMKQTILKHKTRLHAEFVKLKIRKGVKRNQDLISEQTRDHLEKASMIYRHVRINTNRITKEQALLHFKELGYRLLAPEEPVVETVKKWFKLDPDLDELLTFPTNQDFHLDKLYLDGSLILQEKSSCFPAVALSPPCNAHVIDACAAPGNKTTHLSAIMNNTGKIFAFDMDARRLKTLDRGAQKAGCTNIVSRCANFLEINPMDPLYKKVEYILLDPSCSGSGIVSRMDALIDRQSTVTAKEESDRLISLADFQLSVILHAMKFPAVKRIVYSTCSIHEIENEQVVAQVLQQAGEIFQLEKILPSWKHRGNHIKLDPATLTTSEHLSDCVVRCAPEDGTNGFFVSCLVKKQD